ADAVMPFIRNEGWLHTMIIGAPQTGKTTLLRDIARIISTGNSNMGFQASKVGIVDERSEIAGCINGIPQLTFGHRVDILDACPKAEGMMMMIRSMSPEVLVVDEIGRKEDAEAIMEAVHAGISLVMTTHGNSLTEINKRPSLKEIIDRGIFQRFIILSRKRGPGTITHIVNGTGQELTYKERVT
ncbi:MAG: stage III sporulation protein AA, partial [Bacillota bacterium]|nr:stage III sporulation protein AA [Bacillota bacterium]